MVKKKFVFKVTGGDEGFRKGGEILFFILLVGGWGCGGSVVEARSF